MVSEEPQHVTGTQCPTPTPVKATPTRHSMRRSGLKPYTKGLRRADMPCSRWPVSGLSICKAPSAARSDCCQKFCRPSRRSNESASSRHGACLVRIEELHPELAFRHVVRRPSQRCSCALMRPPEWKEPRWAVFGYCQATSGPLTNKISNLSAKRLTPELKSPLNFGSIFDVRTQTGHWMCRKILTHCQSRAVGSCWLS